jgi:hypothetical protein
MYPSVEFMASMGQYQPAVHARHALRFVLPMVGEKVPTGHLVGNTCQTCQDTSNTFFIHMYLYVYVCMYVHV